MKETGQFTYLVPSPSMGPADLPWGGVGGFDHCLPKVKARLYDPSALMLHTHFLKFLISGGKSQFYKNIVGGSRPTLGEGGGKSTYFMVGGVNPSINAQDFGRRIAKNYTD